MSDNPYNFVRVDTRFSTTDTPIYHDNDQEDLHSGELLCTMRLLTPTIVGNCSYNYSVQGTKHTEKILEPMMTADGRVIIPGTTIRGMLRNSIAALCCAPMERVQEQVYGYRPNAQIGTNNTELKPVPMIITHIKGNGDLEVRVFTGKFYFRSSECTPGDEVFCSSIYVRKVYPHRVFNRERKYDEDHSVNLANYDRLTYFGGMNSQKYDSVYVEKTEYQDMTMPKAIWDHYIKTLEFLKNEEHGHISSRHPDSDQVDRIKTSITNVYKQVCNEVNSSIRPEVLNKFVFFAEVVYKSKPISINSIGHHFRYLTRYRDSIHFKDGKLRKEVSPLGCETIQNKDKFRLSAARLLFGVSEDSKNIGAKDIGGEADFHLMGRVFINDAVEDVKDGESLDNRFLNTSNEGKVYLKVLGSPKASAVEHYLTQGSINRSDGGVLRTYGDTACDKSAGGLRGRKFYYHSNPSKAFSNTPNGFDYKLGTCCKWVSKPERGFKFTIRYKNLRVWELELLKFVVEVDLKDCNNLLSEFGSKKIYSHKTEFAHKIGYGRPLGLGSVSISIKSSNKENGNIDELIKKLILSIPPNPDVKKWNKTRNQYRSLVIIPWLEMCRFTPDRSCDYPIKDGEIYKKHMEIRQEHLKGRKYKNNEYSTNNNKLIRLQNPQLDNANMVDKTTEE